MVITGVGLRFRGIDALGGLYDAIKGGVSLAGETDTPIIKGVRALVFSDSLTKKAYAASLDALDGGAVRGDGGGIFLGGAFGSLNSMVKLETAIAENNRSSAMPMEFMNTVMNAAAGQLAILFGISGININVSTGTRAALDAFLYARDMLTRGRIDAALIGGGEDMSEQYAEYIMANGGVPADGACMFAAERFDAAMARGAHIYAELLGGAAGYKENISDITASALSDAGVDMSDIAFIVANGGAAAYDDIPIIDIKKIMRELCGASFAAAAAAAIAVGERGELPDGAALCRKAIALITGAGFDGYCGSLIMRVNIGV